MHMPPPCKPGDRVSVVSPSWAGPEVFPHVHELGLRRLREVFDLEPVEHPTTRRQSSPAERAADVMAAFTDPTTTAVLATIGGEDEIKVLRHLDPDVLRDNPKRFLGYSDNTNLHHLLWGLGLAGCYGGSTMVQLGRGGRMHPETEASMRMALLGGGEVAVPQVAESGDRDSDWADSAYGAEEPELEPAPPWEWHGPATRVTGRTWGGCLEILDFQLRAGRWLRPLQEYDGCVLLLETSEELPDADYVHRVLMGMGERRLLERFAAVAVAKPKTQSLEQPRSAEQRQAYVEAQRAAVLRACAEYAPHAPVVLGLDFGHTDPQVVVPHGGLMTVDPVSRTVTATW
jgi:muramoyltetrapeptide carboxypeptidase LdcA involved in peptidoglycan recycling